MNKKIVITGIGVLSPLGIGKDAFWQGLEAAQPGFRDVSLFDTSDLSVHTAGEVPDFDAKNYLGKKGLRNLDRATKLICSATRLALDDAKFEVTEQNADDTGIVVGTTLGSVSSISEFDKTALRDGFHALNPAAFPNTVINSPASHASIFFKAKGLNSTIATGYTSFLSALYYAMDFLELNRVKHILVGCVEEMCIQTFLGFYKLKFMSGSKDGKKTICCPFDKRRNGIIFSEGACMFMLETQETAQARGAKIYGEVKSVGLGFDCFKIYKYNPRGDGIKHAMTQTLADAEIKPNNIDCLIANANSSVAADKIETEAIKQIFNTDAHKTPISAIKSMLGESYSSSAGFSMAAALCALNKNFIPATINYKNPDPHCDLDYVPNEIRRGEVNNVMINAFGPAGSAASAIISKTTN